MIYIGIDPGKKGGIAMIDTRCISPSSIDIGKDEPEIIIGNYKIFLLETPLCDNEIDVLSIAVFLKTNILDYMIGIDEWEHQCGFSFNEGCFCILEKAQPMPKQGVTSVFTYGEGYGELKAMLKFLRIAFQEVRPQVWKKEFNLNTDKKRSASTCINLFPDIKDKLYGPKGGLKDGIAEALLMAEYGRRIYERKKLRFYR